MTPRDRVRAALAHSEPDFTPCDYFATPEVHRALLAHFEITEIPPTPPLLATPMGGPGDNLLPERLGTDIRYVAPPYVGPPPSADFLDQIARFLENPFLLLCDVA